MATFAASISGDAVANDRDGVFDRTAWQRCAEEGVLSLALPARYNTTGRDTDLLTAAVAMGPWRPSRSISLAPNDPLALLPCASRAVNLAGLSK